MGLVARSLGLDDLPNQTEAGHAGTHGKLHHQRQQYHEQPVQMITAVQHLGWF
jgi:hypothetical protein